MDDNLLTGAAGAASVSAQLGIDSVLQPDQQPLLWDRSVARYEATFEPVTDRFATRALDGLGAAPGSHLLDIGAGAGGAALLAAARGLVVTAIDAAPAMVDRIRARRGDASITARVMDAVALDLPDASMDAALSVFGIVLLPDPAAALREAHRVLKRGGRLALVTWTQPQRYELARRLFASIEAVRGPLPAPPALPPQLRFREESDFRALFSASGFSVTRIDTVVEHLPAVSARALAQSLDFAPGMVALLEAIGPARGPVLDHFISHLELDQGTGPISLETVAFLGVGLRV